ncbi:MAG: hypothetical protein K0S07_293 [Chlamydiales bacterium]|jgi:hypothetical protein|nr:hypothetical protein [Chlamydiales bacterium]
MQKITSSTDRLDALLNDYELSVSQHSSIERLLELLNMIEMLLDTDTQKIQREEARDYQDMRIKNHAQVLDNSSQSYLEAGLKGASIALSIAGVTAPFAANSIGGLAESHRFLNLSAFQTDNQFDIQKFSALTSKWCKGMSSASQTGASFPQIWRETRLKGLNEVGEQIRSARQDAKSNAEEAKRRYNQIQQADLQLKNSAHSAFSQIAG